MSIEIKVDILLSSIDDVQFLCKSLQSFACSTNFFYGTYSLLCSQDLITGPHLETVKQNTP
jgi:hypothetical protein